MLRSKSALGERGVVRFLCHSRRAVSIAVRFGWLPGARYTNLRDVRVFDRLGFLDIDWTSYNFGRHLSAAKATRPMMTVARDVERASDLNRIVDQARELSLYADFVVIVPKARKFRAGFEHLIPPQFILGYSVPSRYGGTTLSPELFTRPVHLLGGRPDVQRQLADRMNVVSVDGNRFTLDAAFGDFFDGKRFRPHPVGGYDRCLTDSVKNIDRLWRNYVPAAEMPRRRRYG